jgi:LmbE family N-acetylglucosaminyl deacetylase
MQRLSFSSLRHVLCLGAHADDIEIGCGGTVLRLIHERPDIEFTWVVFSSTTERSEEARRSATLFLSGAAKAEVIVKEFRDGFFPFLGDSIKECFEELKVACQPDLVLTHKGDDRHQDHRLISELTWNTYRDQLILEYEIPKYDGDLGRPNVYVPLFETHVTAKVRHLLESFETQAKKDWFTADTFRALLRLRGLECRAQDGYAEGFIGRKIVV